MMRKFYMSLVAMLFLDSICLAMQGDRPSSPCIPVPQQHPKQDDCECDFLNGLSPKTKMNLLCSFSGVLITDEFPITFLIAAEKILYTPCLFNKPEATGAIKALVKKLICLDSCDCQIEKEIRFFVAKTIIDRSRIQFSNDHFLSKECIEIERFLSCANCGLMSWLNNMVLPQFQDIIELISNAEYEKIQMMLVRLDFESRKKLINYRDENGNTLLHFCAAMRMASSSLTVRLKFVARLLVLIGIDPNSSNNEDFTCYMVSNNQCNLLSSVMSTAKIDFDRGRQMLQSTQSIFQ